MVLRSMLYQVYLRSFVWGTVLACSVLTHGYGFDDHRTHPQMTEVAVVVSTLDATLRRHLQIDGGVKARINSSSGEPQEILEWLKIGSRLEDSPVCRASNHFHNPLKPFSEAGVTDQDGVGLWCWATTEYKPAYANAPTDGGREEISYGAES